MSVHPKPVSLFSFSMSIMKFLFAFLCQNQKGVCQDLEVLWVLTVAVSIG